MGTRGRPGRQRLLRRTPEIKETAVTDLGRRGEAPPCSSDGADTRAGRDARGTHGARPQTPLGPESHLPIGGTRRPRVAPNPTAVPDGHRPRPTRTPPTRIPAAVPIASTSRPQIPRGPARPPLLPALCRGPAEDKGGGAAATPGGPPPRSGTAAVPLPPDPPGTAPQTKPHCSPPYRDTPRPPSALSRRCHPREGLSVEVTPEHIATAPPHRDTRTCRDQDPPIAIWGRQTGPGGSRNAISHLIPSHPIIAHRSSHNSIHPRPILPPVPPFSAPLRSRRTLRSAPLSLKPRPQGRGPPRVRPIVARISRSWAGPSDGQV